MRRNVATIERFTPPTRSWPVERILKVPVSPSIIVAAGVAVEQAGAPLTGSSSIVYCALDPGIAIHLRGSPAGLVPFQGSLTACGAAPVVHFAQ